MTAILLCPICSTREIDTNYYKAQLEYSSASKSGDMLDLSCCNQCGFVFQNPVFENIENISHYEHNSRYTVQETKGHEIAKENQLDWIECVLKDNGLTKENGYAATIYEIGASVGAFLAKAKDRGWDVSGLEPSQAAIDTAKQNHGIMIEKGFIDENLKIKANVISMFHVLEHIIDPVQCLKHLYKNSPDDCSLFIEVPNTAWPSNCLGGMFWHPEHVNYFSPENLALAGANAGWSCIYLNAYQYAENAQDYCSYPVLRVGFLKRGLKKTGQMKKAVAAFINSQKYNEQDRILNKFQRFLEEGAEKVIIFGAGGHTGMLFSYLDEQCKSRIAGIVDSNPATAGAMIEGHKVETSQNLARYSQYGFVISSQGYQTQIIEYIKSELGENARILFFY